VLNVKPVKDRQEIQRVDVGGEVEARVGETVDVEIPASIAAGAKPDVELTCDGQAVEIVDLSNEDDHLIARVRVLSKTAKKVPFKITISTPKKKVIADGVMNVRPAVVKPKGPVEVDVGEVPATAGEVQQVRVVILATMNSDPQAELQMENAELMRVISVKVEGDHMIATVSVYCNVSRAYPFTMTLSAGSQTVIARGTLKVKHGAHEVLMMAAPVGVSSTDDKVPINRVIKAKTNYRAYFDPPTRKFRVTPAKGVIQPGAKVFPFRVIYTPTEATRSVVLLVVVFNEESERVYEITGAIAGLEGRQWSSRSHKKLKPTSSFVDDVPALPTLRSGAHG
jgi:hypothetical protein